MTGADRHASAAEMLVFLDELERVEAAMPLAPVVGRVVAGAAGAPSVWGPGAAVVLDGAVGAVCHEPHAL